MEVTKLTDLSDLVASATLAHFHGALSYVSISGKVFKATTFSTNPHTNLPEVCAAVTENDFVYLKLHILDFDHSISEVSLQAELVTHTQL